MHNATVSFKNVVETRYSQKSICRTVHRAPYSDGVDRF
jgi:hypothetical protein